MAKVFPHGHRIVHLTNTCCRFLELLVNALRQVGYCPFNTIPVWGVRGLGLTGMETVSGNPHGNPHGNPLWKPVMETRHGNSLWKPSWKPPWKPVMETHVETPVETPMETRNGNLLWKPHGNQK